MFKITVVGGGNYGSLIAQKYKKFSNVEIRTLVSLQPSKSSTFKDVCFLKSAPAWKEKFGSPGNDDIFDMCVHQNILISLLEEFIKIGAINFILPKPIALKKKDLNYIQKLVSRYHLKIVVASQWHYSTLLKKTKDFLDKNKSKVSKVNIVFSRAFDSNRRLKYDSKTAFLPHIIQILLDLRLIKEESKPVIESISNEKIKIRYPGNNVINIESNIASGQKEVLEIFLSGNKKPSLIADFSVTKKLDDIITFPKVMINNKEIQIKEDVLEKMIENNIHYFENSSLKSDILTVDKYLPVAKQIILIAESSKQMVCIIGGGIFGVMAAIDVAKKGYPVAIFEKEKDIMTGASLVNHGRIHMGYHYPRDKKTVIQSLEAKAPFENFCGESIVKKINNYYMVAKEGSMTDHVKFLKFCKNMQLPYKVAWPIGLKISKEKIAVSVKVPETIFDANRMKGYLLRQISKLSNITLLTDAQVVNLKKNDQGFQINYIKNGKQEIANFAAMVNATYGEINHVNDMLGLPLETFQYELCELPVVSAPWKGAGWMIMDGPFFSAMPFGYSKNYLFYDVELSVLERIIDKFPNFKFSTKHYDTKKRRLQRFNKYKEKWKSWIEGTENCEHLYSMYATRIVLCGAEKTDKRPTIIKELLPGFWQIFSGKIAASVPMSVEIGKKIDKFLKKI